MIKADLHVHSKYSRKPSEWFLRKIGAAESYTEPETLYSKLEDKGMDLVTITDHNTIKGCLKLKEKSDLDTFISVESTAHFPEDDCKIHILIYDITESEFEEIQRLRYNIYEMREFIYEKGIAHSVAHPIYSVNDKLTLDHIEKLILMFDNFETVNGCRGEIYNKTITDILLSITRKRFDDLLNKHNLKLTKYNWEKGFTGGSDDHAGLLMGKAYTCSDFANNRETFIQALKDRKTLGLGTSADFYTLAFNIYKISYDYSQKSNLIQMTGGLMGDIISSIATRKKDSFLKKLKLRKLKNKSEINKIVIDMLDNLKRMPEDEMERKINYTYEKASELIDEYLKLLLKKFKKDSKISFDYLYKSIMGSLPGLFVSVPFFSSLKQAYKDHKIALELRRKFINGNDNVYKRVAWFSDTINDLNGVSVTLKNIGFKAIEFDMPLAIFGSLHSDDVKDLPKNFVNCKSIFDFTLPYYKKIKLHIPSFMDIMSKLYKFSPDEIIVSTPGPVGVMGLIIGKLMGVKTTGVYHTDFSSEIYEIKKDDSLTAIVDKYVNYFYNQFDGIKVPSKGYIDILNNRGLYNPRISIFKRGIDTNKYFPIYRLSEINSINLMFAGRVSKDKNIDFLLKVFYEIRHRFRELKIKLFIVGDGPYLEKLTKEHRDKDIIFTGRVKESEMPKYYSLGDIFLFPSTTDTFGMAVLEAQACGLPAVVSDVGGPKEIIIDGVTGIVAKSGDLDEWVIKISELIEKRVSGEDIINNMRFEAVKNVKHRFEWKTVLEDLFLWR
ncbi:MAG: glycosyltransferase [Calditerrivibrio sp.]|uniref:glycosyltransferase n=1 Tax=Calditerrivibrio sp. TaxID=2792612 RepID=UPI003D145496